MSDTEILEDIEKTMETIEKSLDAAEATVAVANRTVFGYLKQPKVLVTGVVVLAVAGSAAAGYFLAKKRLSDAIQKDADAQIADVKARYSVLRKEGEFADPALLAAKYVEPTETEVAEQIIETQNYNSLSHEKPKDDEPKPASVVVQNVFSQNQASNVEEWNYAEEEKHRTEDSPYVIHHDEFMANEKEYEQSTLTYFEGDDILVDERDDIVPNIDDIVGQHNLKFGHGSKDNNIVYVRCDVKEIEWEIVRSRARYDEQILGVMEHSDTDKRVRKFRSWHDG